MILEYLSHLFAWSTLRVWNNNCARKKMLDHIRLGGLSLNISCNGSSGKNGRQICVIRQIIGLSADTCTSGMLIRPLAKTSDEHMWISGTKSKCSDAILQVKRKQKKWIWQTIPMLHWYIYSVPLSFQHLHWHEQLELLVVGLRFYSHVPQLRGYYTLVIPLVILERPIRRKLKFLPSSWQQHNIACVLVPEGPAKAHALKNCIVCTPTIGIYYIRVSTQ
jgi:hypothetical protein